MIRKYGIQCGNLYGNSRKDPFELNYGEIAPGEKTDAPYQHIEAEWFYVIAGQGQIEIDNEIRTLQAGSLIQVNEYQSHQISNTSQQTMKLLSLTTNHPTHAAKPITFYAAALTPNGEMHLGHLSGPYLAADAACRYQKQQNNAAELVTGIDINPSYCKATNFSNEFEQALKKVQIDVSGFYQPQLQKELITKTQALLSQLINSRFIKQRRVKLAYCSSCQSHLTDGELTGICPHCKKTSSGSCCESCFHHADAYKGLIHPHCNQCQAKVTHQEATVYYLQLNLLQDQLHAHWQQQAMTAKLLNLVEEFSHNLNEFPVAYQFNHGEDLTHPSWFDALSYLASIKNPAYCFGYDNAYYFCVLIPAILSALGLNEALAHHWIVNDFLLLDDKKFSTSANHAIWVKAVPEEDIDYLRWYLALNRPEEKPQNFTLEEFNCFKQRIKQLINQCNQDDYKAIKTPFTQHTVDRLSRSVDLLAQSIHAHYHLNQFSLNKVANGLVELLELATHYKETAQPLELLIDTKNKLAQLLSPIAPKLAKTLAVKEEILEASSC